MRTENPRPGRRIAREVAILLAGILKLAVRLVMDALLVVALLIVGVYAYLGVQGIAAGVDQHSVAVVLVSCLPIMPVVILLALLWSEAPAGTPEDWWGDA